MANWAWPEIIDEDSARSAAHVAGGWAAVVGSLTALLTIIGILSSTSIMGMSPLSLVDAALFGLVAWRVWNGSRAWAIAGLALYCLEVIFNVISHPPGVGVLTIIVFLALINGVRGTFGLHKYVGDEQDADGSGSRAERGNEHADANLADAAATTASALHAVDKEFDRGHRIRPARTSGLLPVAGNLLPA